MTSFGRTARLGGEQVRRASDAAAVLKAGRWPLLLSLVIVPVTSVALSGLTPTAYRATATLQFTGFNTGSVAGDVDQAQRALRDYHPITADTLHSTDAQLTPTALRQSAHLTLAGQTRGELTIVRPTPARLHALCVALARRLARDQRLHVASASCKLSTVGPEPLQSGLLAIGLALPLGAVLAAALVAMRIRQLRRA